MIFEFSLWTRLLVGTWMDPLFPHCGIFPLSPTTIEGFQSFPGLPGNGTPISRQWGKNTSDFSRKLHANNGFFFRPQTRAAIWYWIRLNINTYVPTYKLVHVQYIYIETLHLTNLRIIYCRDCGLHLAHATTYDGQQSNIKTL